MTMSEFVFQVRQATSDDLSVLIHLRMEFLREVNDAEFKDADSLRHNLQLYFEEHLSAGTFKAWLAEVNDEIIGTSGLVFFQRPPSMSNVTGLDAYVMNVYTQPAWRGRGVARTLLGHLLDYVKTTSSRLVFLHATPQGRTLYQQMGFHASDEVMELRLG